MNIITHSEISDKREDSCVKANNDSNYQKILPFA